MRNHDNPIEYLYRGVNQSLHDKNSGELIPKEIGKEFASWAECGADHSRSGVVCLGNSPTNEVAYHQWKQKGNLTSGISTTPFIERAKVYALYNEKYKTGIIYKLSVELLNNLDVAIYRIKDYTPPCIPEDDEHILVAKDYGIIPKVTIVETIRVWV